MSGASGVADDRGGGFRPLLTPLLLLLLLLLSVSSLVLGLALTSGLLLVFGVVLVPQAVALQNQAKSWKRGKHADEVSQLVQ